MSHFDPRSRRHGYSRPNRPALDIRDTLDRLEAELQGMPDDRRRAEILAIVGRWRWDPMIRDECQRRARVLFDSACRRS
jgi:hypothetical protein